MADVADLADIPLFRSLGESERKELADRFDVLSIREGADLVGEGASGYSFYVLVEGSAVVTAGGAPVATYGPGDFFGEMAILGDGRRSATVTTTSPSRVLVMFGTEFRRLQQMHPAVAAQLEEALEQRRDELAQLRLASGESQ
jgi:CRP/FNR family transcriptional regulator, cyclic AMP receptor protein